MSRAPAFLCALALVAVAVFSVLSLAPRRALPADADASGFSAERALAHVRAIAGEPRPSGSAAHARAKAYVVETLRGLGLEPRAQKKTVVSTRYGVPFDSASVENLVAVVPGSASGRPVVLVSHLDTVPTSPGAADDGAGVATLLETARALVAGPAPSGDVVLLFTDVEEAGALGAEAYVADDPRSADVVVVNFDARGTGGPVGLIETGPRSGAVVRTLVGLDRTPTLAASSLLPSLARLHGLGTDFRPFREAGARGLNFAIVDGVAAYHTPKDDVSALDTRSLQQQGDLAVGLARRLGLGASIGPDAEPVFFPIPGWGLVWAARLPVVLAAIVSALALLGLAIVELRAGRARVGATLASAVAAVAVPTVAALACYVAWRGVHALDATAAYLRTDDTYAPVPYRIGIGLLGLAATLAGYAAVRRKLGVASLTLGIGAVWAALAVATAFALPGASYVFVLPIVPFLLGAFLLRARGGTLTPSSAWGCAVAAAIGAIPAVVLWAPVPYFLFAGFQLSAAPAVAVAIALPALLALPLLDAAGFERGARSALVAAVAGLALCGYGLGVARFDSAHPRPVSLAVAVDTESGRAFWLADRAIRDTTTDAYFARDVAPGELPVFFSETDTVRRAAEAAPLAVAGPELRLVDDVTTGERRTLRFRLRSRRGAPWATAILESKTRVLETSVDGVSMASDAVADPPPDGTLWGFRHIGLPEEGIEWTLTVERTAEPIRIAVVDQSTGVLTGDGSELRLPDDAMFARSWVSGTTLVRSAFAF